MLKRLSAFSGALAAVLLLAVPGLAYQSSSGASVTTNPSRVAPGDQTTVTATFTDPGSGNPEANNGVTFSQRNGGGNGCTVSFNPSTTTTDSSGTATSTATIGTTCRGSVDLCATDTQTGQFGCAAVIVNDGHGNGGPGKGNGAPGNGKGGGGNGRGGGGGSNGNHGQAQPSSTKVAAVVTDSGVGLLAVLLLVGGLLFALRRRGPRTVD